MFQFAQQRQKEEKEREFEIPEYDSDSSTADDSDSADDNEQTSWSEMFGATAPTPNSSARSGGIGRSFGHRRPPPPSVRTGGGAVGLRKTTTGAVVHSFVFGFVFPFAFCLVMHQRTAKSTVLFRCYNVVSFFFFFALPVPASSSASGSGRSVHRHALRPSAGGVARLRDNGRFVCAFCLFLRYGTFYQRLCQIYFRAYVVNVCSRVYYGLYGYDLPLFLVVCAFKGGFYCPSAWDVVWSTQGEVLYGDVVSSNQT